jgi:cytochrome P450
MALSLRSLIRPLAVRAMLVQEWWQSGVTYNPLSPRVYTNPYPTYAALRAKDPVHWSPLMDSWVLSRYADVDTVLRDHKRFSSDGRNRTPSRRRQPQSAMASADPSMLFLDPPDHTRLRALVNKAFTPQAIEALKPRIQAIVAELLDQIDTPSAFDLIEAIAYPLPVIVMAALLGVPPKDRVQFKHWSDRRARALEPTIKPHEVQEAIKAGNALDAYFLGIIRERRQEPRHDLISSLVAAEEAGDKLTEREMVVMLRLLLVAGNETTTNLIGNGMLALLQHPEQLQRLRDNPSLMPVAIEELLRYDPPVQVDGRTVLEDVEIRGRQVKKGQGVVLLLGAANHDPEVFSHPERLDIARQEASNIAFGRGIHHCLGAPLARLEGRIAFTALLERYSDMRLLTARPAFKDNIVLRGLRTLPMGATPVRH